MDGIEFNLKVYVDKIEDGKSETEVVDTHTGKTIVTISMPMQGDENTAHEFATYIGDEIREHIIEKLKGSVFSELKEMAKSFAK